MSTYNKEIESIINNLQKKVPSLDRVTGEFYQTFKKNTSICYNFFQKTEADEIFPNSFYETSINYKPVSFKNTNIKIPNKILANQIHKV
jgi:hypothetical protein